jgi:dihydroxyacetone kinase-like predicted kinase
MTSAIASLRTVEVTRAAASRTAEGIAVREGEWLALVDTRLVASTGAAVDALLEGLRSAAAGVDPELITVYRGQGDDLPRETLIDAIAAAFPSAGVEILDGAQPLYVFIASIE